MAERKKPNLFSEGQIRWNLLSGEVVCPHPIYSQNIVPREITRSPEERKPDVAYINDENLGILKDRIGFNGLDSDLIKRLKVFKARTTKIMIDPTEEKAKGYSVKLNIGIIAQEILAIDDHDVPYNHRFYELLGVYSEYNGNPKVSKNKSIRNYATVQRSNCPQHPDVFQLGSKFFARPEDEIIVKKSKFNKTGYYWAK